MSRADEQDPLLPPDEEAEVLTALEAAWRPAELSPEVNERLLERALEDPFAPATEEELAESARLRDALEGGSAHEDAAALAALRVAFDAGTAPHPEQHVTAAVDHALAARPRRGNVIYVAFGAASAVVAAAAVALLFAGTLSHEPAEPAFAELAKPRSTAALFSERFETADTTARMDVIASARGRDLRDNRYAAWGVR